MSQEIIKVDLSKDILDLNPLKYKIYGQLFLNQFTNLKK